MRTSALTLTHLGVVGLLCACSGSDSGTATPDAAVEVDAGVDAMIIEPELDLSGEMFKPDEVLEIEIEIDNADWDTLRYQSRNTYDVFAGADCQAAPYDSPYVYYPGSAIINGDRIDNIGVRKKGFIGSSNPTKPSLKLNLDLYVPDQEYSSVENFTLNNGTQFFSPYLLLTQCLGYKLFADAGVPAQRCNFAHVTVNDQDMGIYVHVERVRRPMLERFFEDGDGLLWEGTLSDFRDGWLGTFDQKTNEAAGLTTAPLATLATTLELPDTLFVQALDEILDLDRYLTFWAMEVLVGHWDGYAGNTNNFFVYEDPLTGLLHFLPWGIDALFSEPGNANDRLALARSSLSRRLYGLPLMRARFVGRVAELVDTLWIEDDLVAEVDRMEALLSPYIVDNPLTLGDEPTIFANQNQKIRNYINNRRAFLEPLILAPPVVDGALYDDRCVEPNGTYTATFSTTWQAWNSDPLANGSTASPAMVLGGTTYTIVDSGAVAGAPPGNPIFPNGLRIVATHTVNNTPVVVTILMKAGVPVTGTDIAVDWVDTRASYGFGGMADGTLNFTAFEATNGGEVSGTVTLRLFQ